MDVLFSFATLLLLATPLGIASAYFVARSPQLFDGMFGPRRGDGWPRGVQEEDPSFVRTFRLGPTPDLPPGDDEIVPPPTDALRPTVSRRH